jgi:hypothetical protein
MQVATGGDDSFTWGELRLSATLPASTDRRTWMAMRHVDSHHTKLLQSTRTGELLEGLCSVVFWTRVRIEGRKLLTSGALTRLGQLRSGRKGLRPQSIAELSDLLEGMREQLSGGSVGNALETGLKIKLAGLPIATRLMAMMAPSLALPYDNMTAQGLISSKAASHLYFPVLTSTLGARGRQLSAYERWCRHVIDMARQLQIDGACWTDWDLSQNPFQPIDVQRAYEALGSA